MSTQSSKSNSAQSGALLDFALGYGRRAWSVIAVIDKRAAGLWLPFQARPADETTQRMMFARPGITGLAVITGKVSGGLAVRDFDVADAYHAWAALYPTDAARLPTVRTARGFHVYGALDAEAFAELGDGELRADSKHYVLLPPSVHPEGAVYTWTIALPPVGAPLPSLPPSLTQAQAKQTHTTPSKPTACATRLNGVVKGLIADALPSGPRQRNRRLFDLARAVKGVMPNAPADRLLPVLVEWHRQALPHIRTKDFGESWTDFVVAWERVKRPQGASLYAAVAAAESVILSGHAATYDGHLFRLARLCAALQAQSGDRPFPLSCRIAADYLHTSPVHASRLFKTLAFDGALQLVRKGTKKSGKASEWRFIDQKSERYDQ
jgi:Bifunctional DNA primase/polymerase, N-terminal